MRVRIVPLIVVCVAVAGCAAPVAQKGRPSIEAPGGPVPAGFSLCDLNPAPSACTVPDTELTAATARKRLDAEYARLEKAAPRYAARFATDSLIAAELRAGSRHYLALRDLAWKAAFKAPREDGTRYFLLRDIGKAAFEAGDRAMALETIRQRRKLIRGRRDDQEWQEWNGGDVIITLSRKEAWRITAFDAARFRDADLAIAVLNDAVPISTLETFEYLSDVLTIRLSAAQYEQAEALARRIIETAPSRYGEMREMYQDEKIGGNTSLIISLLKQGKETGDLADQLFRNVAGLPTSLSDHADNFFAIARKLADTSPEIARRFLNAGQEINRITGVNEDFPDRYVEVDICKTLRDDDCLARIARESEAGMKRESFYFFQIASFAYAVAGDFSSVRRLMPTADAEHCYVYVYPAIAERLAQDNHLKAIPGWLRNWVTCQLTHNPNYLHWTGLALNRWSEIARTYARLSRWQSNAEVHRAALGSAKTALLLAIEAEKTWRYWRPDNNARNFYRARDFARAYGSALGALVRAEAAVSAGR